MSSKGEDVAKRQKIYILLLGVFEDDDVTHIEGDVNPIRDLDIILEELRLKVWRINQLIVINYDKFIIRMRSIFRRDSYGEGGVVICFVLSFD